MLTTTLIPTVDYTSRVIRIMRRLPIEKQAQIAGYVDAIGISVENDASFSDLSEAERAEINAEDWAAYADYKASCEEGEPFNQVLAELGIMDDVRKMLKIA